MKLYVTNISPRITEISLRKLFGRHGTVLSIELSRLNRAGSTSGVAVLEMEAEDALIAINALNGQPSRNRRLYITVMKEKDDLRKSGQPIFNQKNTGVRVMKAAGGSAL